MLRCVWAAAVMGCITHRKLRGVTHQKAPRSGAAAHAGLRGNGGGRGVHVPLTVLDAGGEASPPPPVGGGGVWGGKGPMRERAA